MNATIYDNPDHELLRDQVARFLAREVEPHAAAWEETGMVPRDVLRRFTCRYDGATVFAADLYPAIAANPYLAFHVLATASGPMTFTWEGDNGFAQTETAAIVVT